MARSKPLLTDAPWEKIAPQLPALPQSRKGGRRWKDHRAVLEGILGVLKTGARWRDLPPEYPRTSTCWRRLRLWEENDVWLDVWRALVGTLDERKQWDGAESFAGGSFAPAKKGVRGSARPRGGKARRGWWWSTAQVLLSESPGTLRPRRKSRSGRRRSRRSPSRDRVGAGRGKIPRA